MPRKTKYRVKRQKKNKTKRRINKLFIAKTYKKLYNNRRFTGGVGKKSIRNAAAAAAAVAAATYFYPGASVSTVPVSYRSQHRPIHSPSPVPPPPTSTSSHSRLSSYPPAPPPISPRSQSRLPPPLPSRASPSSPPLPPLLMQPSLSMLYSSPMLYSSLLKKAQINRDGKVTDIIATDYSQKGSAHLLDEPPSWVVEKAKKNLAPDRSESLIILPRILPNIAGVNWSTIMSKIHKFYAYLGQTFGEYEVHLIASTTDSKESDRIVREVHHKIEQDTVNGNYIPTFEQLKNCGTAVCHNYEAMNGKMRYLVNIDIAFFYELFLQTTYFTELSNEDKEQYILDHIYYYMAHEYYHVFQNQLITPVKDPNRFGAEDTWAMWGNDKTRTSGEKQPHALSRWWMESFATIMPYFMGISLPDDKGMLLRVANAITNIKSDETLTQEEFSDRMMYKYTDYGYLMADNDLQDWAFLGAVCMAKQTSWNYLLAGHFYKDFQRIPSTTKIKRDGQTISVPDADQIWLHNFGMTQKEFLHYIFNQVKTGIITPESLIDFLPRGTKWEI